VQKALNHQTKELVSLTADQPRPLCPWTLTVIEAGHVCHGQHRFPIRGALACPRKMRLQDIVRRERGVIQKTRRSAGLTQTPSGFGDGGFWLPRRGLVELEQSRVQTLISQLGIGKSIH